ncbi:glycerol-3-phosphate 1-O-acyltransferase PlsY [Hespellia stercorisuis]|uniref:Glycerol-3-phosphate acyltransferase n=1 Tax=Hespellia stercorisuis DSM 15480 TaxID=1121950 RepID=A0A1M6HU95_9FIRM|nr:glycerol-3-phosphate 1-O-acyltransferase PlsY [Hespellia stercorisuis]SHJ25730.1 acyl-phosphate glycerol-3-phosphate acyltransferase [Hespellia stercorisuis DSM 15480]
MERIICILIGYVFGLFQTGYLYGKIKNIDIRSQGSGNAGSTNALRVMGIKAGIITLLGDCLKCVLAIVTVRLIFADSHPESLPLLSLYAGLGTTLGHNFPFYLKFKGGKGIAVLAGMFLATSWWMTLTGIVVFFGLVLITRYVSVGSLAASLLFAVEIIIYGQMGGFQMTRPLLYEMYAVAVFLAALAWYRHRANIKRLLQGTENKFGSKKK